MRAPTLRDLCKRIVTLAHAESAASLVEAAGLAREAWAAIFESTSAAGPIPAAEVGRFEAALHELANAIAHEKSDKSVLGLKARIADYTRFAKTIRVGGLSGVDRELHRAIGRM